MSEMSYMFKLVNQMELAKKARVGMELTYFDVIELLGELESLKFYIAELESERRWIPVSERLPEEDTDGNALMAICRYSGEWVRTAFGAEFADEFVRHYSYWMYAPQPPEVQE